MFTVERRNEMGRWRPVNFGTNHATLEQAIERVTSCDPDGWFTSDMRVVKKGEGVVYTAEDWRKAKDLDAKA